MNLLTLEEKHRVFQEAMSGKPEELMKAFEAYEKAIKQYEFAVASFMNKLPEPKPQTDA